MDFDDRPDAAKRLEQARVARGFKTAKDAARYFGWTYETYIQHEQGTRGLSRAASKYADALRVGAGWLLAGEGKGPAGHRVEPDDDDEEFSGTVPLVGYVGAGAAAHYYGDSPGELDRVSAPKNPTKETVAVEIRGDSLGPLLNRWLVYYDQVRSPVTPELFGILCVVGLADDRVLVKRIRQTPKPGLYDLESNTGEALIRGVMIMWAAKVRSIEPR